MKGERPKGRAAYPNMQLETSMREKLPRSCSARASHAARCSSAGMCRARAHAHTTLARPCAWGWGWSGWWGWGWGGWVGGGDVGRYVGGCVPVVGRVVDDGSTVDLPRRRLSSGCRQCCARRHRCPLRKSRFPGRPPAECPAAESGRPPALTRSSAQHAQHTSAAQRVQRTCASNSGRRGAQRAITPANAARSSLPGGVRAMSRPIALTAAVSSRGPRGARCSEDQYSSSAATCGRGGEGGGGGDGGL
jgi:hypothetical protein